jgi:hydroxymethylpyrimidine/phosphomethylpyrimidine kinase
MRRRRIDTMPTVLTIAGYDPSSGAGVTADLMVFAAHGLFGTSAITSLTVQSTVGVRASHAVLPQLLADTLDCLYDDLPPAGIKIGMIATADNVHAVAAFLTHVRAAPGPRIPVVLDPILRSTGGRELLDLAGLSLLRDTLLGLVDWVTPNLAELGILLGRDITLRGDLPAACRDLRRLAPGLGVFATGGHLTTGVLPAQPDDLLSPPTGDALWLPGIRVETRATHGTGCALSSAFLSNLVLGQTPAHAAHAAKDYVAQAMRTAAPIGSGHGPMNLLWPLRTP